MNLRMIIAIPPKKRRRKNVEDSERERNVQECVKDLNKKHGSVYSPMQLRIWGELRAGGFHNSLDDPPTFNTMFQRAGGESSKKQSPVVKAVTEAATAITAAVLKRPENAPVQSPVKVIESRSKLYGQLSDLKNLKDDGIMNEDEFFRERQIIMDLLQKITAK